MHPLCCVSLWWTGAQPASPDVSSLRIGNLQTFSRNIGNIPGNKACLTKGKQWLMIISGLWLTETKDSLVLRYDHPVGPASILLRLSQYC